MKHAGPGALEHLADLLVAIRTRSRLREKRPGIFYLAGRSFLHFHEDPSGLYADVRPGGDWLRLPVNEPEERARLLAGVDRILAAATPRFYEGADRSARGFRPDGSG